MNPTINSIKERRAVRAYKDKAIEKEKINEIIECGIWAPSARNNQSWKFVALTNRNLIKKIAKRILDKIINNPRYPFVRERAKTKEDPKKILAHINKIKNKIPNMKKYKAFYLIIPEEFPSIRDMFLTKFDELFGPMLTCRCWSYETTKHAKTVIPWDKELFISFGHENKIFGKNRYNVPLPKGASYATLMAVGYYVIGQIQKDNPAYFKKNIVAFTKAASKLFGSDIQPIVK